MAEQASQLPPTTENLARALWEIDKAAKRLFDPARRYRPALKPGLAQDHLRNATLEKMSREGVAELAGFHVMQDRVTAWEPAQPTYDDEEDDDCVSSPHYSHGGRWVTKQRVTHVACYRLGGYRFVRVVDNPPRDLPARIKDLDHWLSGATRPLGRMELKDAKALLRAYLGEDVKNR